MAFNIVLVEPEIPQNTGNIVRTAAATGCKVHLIKPIGFDISDRALKRAGLDYWHLTDFIVYENLEEFFDKIMSYGSLLFDKNADGRVHKTTDGSWHIDGNDERTSAPHFYFCSTKAAKRYDEAKFGANDFLFFGRESKGLPEELLHDNYDMTIRIPMVKEARSLNLSNSVAIVVYEGMRQLGFENLLCKGHLTKF